MCDSRTKNTLKNAKVGFALKLLMVLANFANRTVFIAILGADYLGISSLFTNVLSLLSLADLGVGTVLTFSLYKPLAESDEETVAGLIAFYRKVYFLIAAIVAGIGIALFPFLPFLVNGTEISSDTLTLYYLMYVTNSVVSYFAVYKSTLLNANQEIYIVQIVQSVVTCFMYVLQIALLWFTHDFIFFLIALISCTLLNNIILTVVTKRRYPFLSSMRNSTPPTGAVTAIIDNLKSAFVYKLGGVLMTSSTSIVISIVVGTVSVGFYSNYYMVISTVNAFIMVGIQAVLSSIGNLNASESSARKREVFEALLLLFFIIGTICSLGMLLCFDSFISLWVGSDYVLDGLCTAVIVVNFFLSCVANPVWMYRESSGLFKDVKYLMVIAALLCIAMSAVFGCCFGMFGVLLGLPVSRLVTLFWCEPSILYKKVFEATVSLYWSLWLKLAACAGLSFILVSPAIFLAVSPQMKLLIGVILSMFIPVMVFLVAFRGGSEVKFLKEKLKHH